METELLQELIELLRGGVSLRPAAFFYLAVVVGLAAYVGSYLRAKAENLATKEDVAAITQQVESVRTEHAARLEELFQRNRLQLAALDKRLDAHQEAYALWRKLVFSVHGEDLNDVVIMCQDWWTENCLYLDENARDAFSRAYHAAHLHPSFLREPRDEEGAERNWRIVEAAGEALVRGAGLPSLGERERDLDEN